MGSHNIIKSNACGQTITDSLSKDYFYPDDHTTQCTVTHGVKLLLTAFLLKDYFYSDDHTIQCTLTPGVKPSDYAYFVFPANNELKTNSSEHLHF